MSKLLVPDRNIKVKVVRGRKGVGRRAYRVRAERALGRTLKRSEEVHHHTAEQLVICQDHAYHGLLHARARIVRAGGDPDSQAVCNRCKQVLPLSEFSPNRADRTGRNHMCKPCESKRKSAPMRRARAVIAVLLLLLIAAPVSAEENILRWPKGQKVAERISDVAVWTNIGAQLAADLRAEDRKHALSMSACRWGITLGVAGLSKQFIHRTRPDGSNDRSFPSGHTMNAFANTGWNYQVSVPIALSTGYMRSAGNKHYVSDVVVGGLVGILAARVCPGGQ